MAPISHHLFNLFNLFARADSPCNQMAGIGAGMCGVGTKGPNRKDNPLPDYSPKGVDKSTLAIGLIPSLFVVFCLLWWCVRKQCQIPAESPEGRVERKEEARKTREEKKERQEMKKRRKEAKALSKASKFEEKPLHPYNGELRNQDRMNKSLRWKTLKKWFGADNTRGGDGCVQEAEKAADVEALNGTKIRPLKEWTISPTSSTESLPKPEPTRWQKLTGIFGAKTTEREVPATPVSEKPELQEPAEVVRREFNNSLIHSH